MLFDTDGDYDFDDDDTYLSFVLTSARQAMEDYTGLSFGTKTIEAVLRNDLGGIEIPYGPIVSITSLHDVDGNEITSSNYTITGLNYKRIISPCLSYIRVIYTAGFTSLPDALKMAVLEEAAYRYHHRGEEDEVSGYCKSALNVAAPYKRKSWLV